MKPEIRNIKYSGAKCNPEYKILRGQLWDAEKNELLIMADLEYIINQLHLRYKKEITK